MSNWINFFKCQFKHPIDLPEVYVPHLQLPDGSRRILEPLDAMFWHGHTFINKEIQICQDFALNHVSCYIGEKRRKDGTYENSIIHAVYPKVIIQDLKEAWLKSDKYILIFRYINDDGLNLSFLQRDKITEDFNRFLKENAKYSVGELLELLILTKNRDKISFIERKFLDRMMEGVNSLLEEGRQLVTCYELIHRSFTEGNAPIRLKDGQLDVNFNFITPKDGALSPNFKLIGRLVKEF